MGDGIGMPRLRGLGRCFVAVCIAASLLACAGDDEAGDAGTPAAGDGLAVSAVSTRADAITGDDVLLRIAPLPDPGSIVVTRDGQALPFEVREIAADAVTGLLSGLQHGANTVRVRAQIAGQTVSSALELRNHPLTGPVFSGPHQQPFVCRTVEAGLGEPLDANCSVATQITYLYKRNGLLDTGLTPLPDPLAPYPGDLDYTTTVDGERVPFIVRVESGTINRSIYRIAVLDDPQAREATAPYTPTKGWNRRLIYSFGGGCGSGLHQGGGAGSYARIDEVTLPWILADGYAQIVSSLNELATSCNDVLSAETMMMVKESFIERYGVPKWTMGRGGSGGSIQQSMLAQNYPGLLDGLVLKAGFADNTTVATDVLDCVLLRRAFAERPLIWNALAQPLMTGFATASTCAAWANAFAPILVQPAVGCPAGLPAESIYDPVSNPRGVRCTVPETLRNIYGVDAQTGFAPNWYDNEGVQYGLEALRDGRITPARFIEFNRDIGGLDIDGVWQPQRSRADPGTLRTAYASGRVVHGTGLGHLPVLDINYYADSQPNQNIHDRIRSFIIRERIRKAHGDADNHVMWTYNSTGLIFLPFFRPDADGSGTDTMREWLDALSAQPQRDRAAVIATKPATARDRCVLADGLSPLYQEAGGGGLCDTAFPVHSIPRMRAGAPAAGDILKCELKAIDVADYGNAARRFSPEQWQALAAVFPTGVCDYSRPGVEQRAPIGTWLRYDRPFPQQ